MILESVITIVVKLFTVVAVMLVGAPSVELLVVDFYENVECYSDFISSEGNARAGPNALITTHPGL